MWISVIENAQYDATELLLLVMGISRTQYLINSMDKIDSGKLAEYAELINKRAEHIPLQHITGTVNFYGREYKVKCQCAYSKAGYRNSCRRSYEAD